MKKALAVISLIAAAGCFAADLPEASWQNLPRWRGFNLLEKFYAGGRETDRAFLEEDFAWIAEFGFNFARLPMDYRTWILNGDPRKFNEPVLREIDQAVQWGKKYGVHVMINFHRAPGYTVAEPPEKMNVWTDDEALELCALHWGEFARRCKGVPSRQLSFNLFNEPDHRVPPEQYARVVGRLCAAIREQDTERLIVCDGLAWGGKPVEALVQHKVAQAMRGYQPFQLTHYKAGWVQGSGEWPRPAWPVAQVNQFLYGDAKPDFKAPLVIEGPVPAGASLRLRVQTVSARALLSISADDCVIFQHDFQPGPGTGEWEKVVFKPEWQVYQNVYNRDYAVVITGRVEKLSIEVLKGDWLQLSEVGMRLKGSEAESTLFFQDAAWGRRREAPLLFRDGALRATQEIGRAELKCEWVTPWTRFKDRHKVGVMVGEFGAYKFTPHDVVMRWMEDCLSLWQEAGIGWALWNFRGSFGIIDSERTDVAYEDWHGHKLDRRMLDLLQRY